MLAMVVYGADDRPRPAPLTLSQRRRPRPRQPTGPARTTRAAANHSENGSRKPPSDRRATSGPIAATDAAGTSSTRSRLHRRPGQPQPTPPHSRSRPTRPPARSKRWRACWRRVNPKAQIIVGWITVQAARTWRMSVSDCSPASQVSTYKSIFPPDGSKEIHYAPRRAQTDRRPLRLARGIPRRQPSPRIERTRPAHPSSRWARQQAGRPRRQAAATRDNPERILKLQSRYGGIVAIRTLVPVRQERAVDHQHRPGDGRSTMATKKTRRE